MRKIYDAVRYGYTEVRNCIDYQGLDVLVVLESMSWHIRERMKKEKKEPCYYDSNGEPRYTSKGGLR